MGKRFGRESSSPACPEGKTVNSRRCNLRWQITKTNHGPDGAGHFGVRVGVRAGMQAGQRSTPAEVDAEYWRAIRRFHLRLFTGWPFGPLRTEKPGDNREVHGHSSVAHIIPAADAIPLRARALHATKISRWSGTSDPWPQPGGGPWPHLPPTGGSSKPGTQNQGQTGRNP